MDSYFRVVVAVESSVRLGAIDTSQGHALVCTASEVSQTAKLLQKKYPGSIITVYTPSFTEFVNLVDIDE